LQPPRTSRHNTTKMVNPVFVSDALDSVSLRIVALLNDELPVLRPT
jgi:hypothetical protein